MAMADQGAAGRASRPILAGTVLMIIFGLLWALASIRSVFVLLFIAILLASIFAVPIDYFARRLPRGAAVAVLLLGLAGLGALLVLLVAPIVSAQIAELGTQLPQALGEVDRWWSHTVHSRTLSSLPKGQGQALEADLRERWTHLLSQVSTMVIPLASTTASALSAVVIVVALAFFFAADPNGYRDGLRALLPAPKKQMVDEAWRRIGVALRQWMVGILISMTIMGTVAAVGLRIAGINGWLALGLLTFFGTFVPYVGALASALPGLAVGLSQSPAKLGYALVVYLVVHLIEGYVVEPMIMKRAVLLRPAVLLFFQLLMVGIFGVLGFVVATPLLVCLQIAIRYLYIEEVLGER